MLDEDTKADRKAHFPTAGCWYSACGLGLGETEMPGQEGSYHNSPCRRRGCGAPPMPAAKPLVSNSPISRLLLCKAAPPLTGWLL